LNIKQVKEQILNTVRAYLAKDENGRYLIPGRKQRPMLIMGPPGIGKTEIMSQIASELDIGLLSYSMTHHTRQSAIGLPMICRSEYKGESFSVTQYTMSEILSSVYDLMKNSGVENGILFLDEINCISETLMPVMLQFLQYKVFGGHTLPEGWVIVTAGNPPEYNSSVRELDVATCDRLKILSIEPDFEAWKEFAYTGGVHSAVITYLEIKPANFYRIESTAGEKHYVTARGWDDLSRMINVYEHLGIEVDNALVKQYITIDKVAEDFTLYYDLYKKYRNDYHIGEILSGTAGEDIVQRAKNASFDERYSLLGLILNSLREKTGRILDKSRLLVELKNALSTASQQESEGVSAADSLEQQAQSCRDKREQLALSGGLSEFDDKMLLNKAAALDELSRNASAGGYEGAKDAYLSKVDQLKKQIAAVKDNYSNAFVFCENAFGEGREILILVTELAADPSCAKFISDYGCEEYYKYDKKLMFYEHRLKVIDEIQSLSENEQ